MNFNPTVRNRPTIYSARTSRLALPRRLLATVLRCLVPLGVCLCLLLPASAADTIVLYVDCSGSMAGRKAKAAMEGAKLAMAMAGDSTISIVAFSEVAVAGTFSIPRDRDQAIKWVDSFHIDGSTNYIAALKAVELPAGAVGIFLSDGEPNTGGDPREILDYLKAHTKGTLHTISVGCPAGSEAERLLTQMAAIKGGSFTRRRGRRRIVGADYGAPGRQRRALSLLPARSRED